MGKLAKNLNYLRNKHEKKRLKRQSVLSFRQRVYKTTSKEAIKRGLGLFQMIKQRVKQKKLAKEQRLAELNYNIFKKLYLKLWRFLKRLVTLLAKETG